MDQTASLPVLQQPQPAVPFTASSAWKRLSAFSGTSPNSFSDASFPAPGLNPFRSGPILSPVFTFNTPSPTATTQLPLESGSFRFQFPASSSSAAPTFAFPPSTASAPASINAFKSPPTAQPPSTSLPVPVTPTTVSPPPSTPQFGSGLNFPTPILTANSSSARPGGAPHPPAGPAQGAGGPSGGQPAAQPAGEAPGPAQGAAGPPGAGTLPKGSFSVAAIRRAAGVPGPAEPAGAGTPSFRLPFWARSVPTGAGTPEVFSFTPSGPEAGEPGPSVRPGRAGPGGTARAIMRRSRAPKPNSDESTETQLPKKATHFVVESTEEFPLDEIFMTELGFAQSRTGQWTIGEEGEDTVSTDTNLGTPKETIGEETKVNVQKDGEDDTEKLLVVYEKEPPEFCLCTICQGVLNDPVQLPMCPHVMCKTCIESWIIMSATCPTCRKVIPRKHHLVPNLFAAKAIRGLRVRCPYGVIPAERKYTTSTDTTTPPKSPVAKISPLESDAATSGIVEPFFLGKTHRLLHGGCSAVVSRRELESHVTKCDQRTRDCTFGCGLRGPPDVLDLHRCRKSSDKILKKQIAVTKQLALDLTRKASSTCSRLRTENGHLRSRLDLRNPDGSFDYNAPDPFHLALRIVNLLSKEGLEGFRTFRDPIFRKVATMWMDIRRKEYDFGTFHGMKSLLGILLDSVPERSWSLGQLGTIKLWRQEVDGIVVENSIITSLKDI